MGTWAVSSTSMRTTWSRPRRSSDSLLPRRRRRRRRKLQLLRRLPLPLRRMREMPRREEEEEEGRQVNNLLLDHAYRRTNGSCSWSGLNRLTLSAVQWLAAAWPWSPPSLKHSSDLANHMAWMFIL